MSERPPIFTPHFRAALQKRRAVLFLMGPLLWLVALVVLGVVLKRADIVEIGLVIAAGSFGLASALLVPMRWKRLREEREE